MLQLLTSREQGDEPPWLLPKLYSSRRFAAIELRGEREFDKGHRNGIKCLDLDKEGRYLISGGADVNGTVLIHNIQLPAGVDQYKYKYPVVATAGTPVRSDDESHAISVVQWYVHDNGIFTTSSKDKLVRVWDTNELCVVEKFKFSAPVYTHSMAASESHSLIAVGGKECTITLCDIQTGSSTHSLRSHRKPVVSLAWSPRDEYLLASGSQDMKVLFWDIRKAAGPLMDLDQYNGRPEGNTASSVTAHNGQVNGLCFSSDGLHLLSFGRDHNLRLWDTCTGRNSLINYGRVHNSFPTETVQFCVSPHTSTLHPIICLPSCGDILMFEMLTGKKIKKMQGHFGQVGCLFAHHFEQELYSGGSDCNILSWAPPPPRLPEEEVSHSRGVRSRAARVYQDSWSSDEDDFT